MPDPARGAHRATLAGSHVPVYALVGQLAAYAGDPDPGGRVAADYAVPREAVGAALVSYRRHRAAIDAVAELNRPPATAAEAAGVAPAGRPSDPASV